MAKAGIEDVAELLVQAGATDEQAGHERLVDWMGDERLRAALDALERGTIDPVELRSRGPLMP